MRKVEEIEAAMAKLPEKDFERVVTWIEERIQSRWDRQLEADAKSGKLETLRDRLAKEKPGEEVPLYEFLDDSELS